LKLSRGIDPESRLNEEKDYRDTHEDCHDNELCLKDFDFPRIELLNGVCHNASYTEKGEDQAPDHEAACNNVR
jgi:hypothetical protein